jgi:hypothetical protein
VTEKNASTWAATIAGAVLVAMTESLSLHGAIVQASPVDVSVRFLHALFAVGMILFLFLLKKRWNQVWAMVIFSALLLPYYGILWFHDLAMAASHRIWTPFYGFKIIFLGLGLLVTNYVLNIVLMVALGFECVLLWHVGRFAEIPTVLASSEPQATLLFAMVSAVLLYSHFHEARTLQKLVETRTQAEFMETVAKVFLTLRSRANTPLQTVTLSCEVLRRRAPQSVDVISIIEDAIAQLNVGSQFLSELDNQIHWNGKELMSEEEIRSWLNRTLSARRRAS